MCNRLVTIIAAIGFAACPLLADFSYREKSTITGGAAASMMKVVGVFSKAAREPNEAAVSVKGARMVHRGNSRVSIIDLDAETITDIDVHKKTYTVLTFAQMRETIERMQERAKQDPHQMSFQVNANKTGNHKTIDGRNASEIVLTMQMQGTDQQSGQRGGLSITTDVWIAPPARGYAELHAFTRRLAEKLNWTPGGNMFLSNPKVSEGMVEVSKEMNKLDGMPVLETVSMGGSSESGGSAGSLLEMTIEMSGFSTDPADESAFEVPAGFKKVESNSRRGR